MPPLPVEKEKETPPKTIEAKKEETSSPEIKDIKKSPLADGDKPRFAFTEETLSKKITLPDLNNLDKPSEDKEVDEPKLNIKEKKKLTTADINKVWINYVSKLEKDGNTSAEMLFKEREIEIHAEKEFIVVHFENRVQLDNFEELKTDLLFYLRQNLSNADVRITAKVKEQSIDSKRLYTDKDKLEFLIEKKPIIQDLKDRLGLDAEY